MTDSPVRFRLLLSAAIGLLFLIWTSGPVIGGDPPRIRFSDGYLTINATKTPLIPLLESLSEASGIEILIAEDLGPHEVTANFLNVPLEEALKRMLRGLNHALVYEKRENILRLRTLKIYPDGKETGAMIPVTARVAPPDKKARQSEADAVIVRSGEEAFSRSEIHGYSGYPESPSEHLSPTSSRALVSMQEQLYNKEIEQHQKMLLMSKKAASPRDAEGRDAMNQAVLEEAVRLHQIKSSNLNKVEALKRILESREINPQN
jgi:hypothetical protein